MEQAGSGGTHEPARGGGASDEKPWSEWESYYAEASRRRRARGDRYQFREQKRRRILRERLGLMISATVIGAMTLAFYLLLTR